MTQIASTRPFLPSWRLALWGGVIALLLLPLIAMPLTAEVAWTASDFAAAAILLGGAAGLVELAVATIRRPVALAAAIGAVLMALVLLWLQGAVGLV